MIEIYEKMDDPGKQALPMALFVKAVLGAAHIWKILEFCEVLDTWISKLECI